MSVERVAHPAEEAALLAQLGHILPARLGEVAEHAFLVGGQLGRRLDVEVHEEVPAALAAQVRHALAADAQRAGRLGAGLDLDGLLAVQRLDRQPGAERRGGHREGDAAVQVVALAGVDVVRAFVDLDVEVAGGSAARADLALLGQADAHAVLDAGRDLDGERAAGADPAVAGAGGTGVRDDRAVALADLAGPRRDDLAEEGALHGLDLAAPAAGLAGGQVGAGGRAGAGALGAQHRGVDGDRRLDAEGGLDQVQFEAQDGVGARAGAGTRPPGTAAGGRAEERVHDVLEADERPGAAGAGGSTPARGERVATEVDDLPLLVVGQDL